MCLSDVTLCFFFIPLFKVRQVAPGRVMGWSRWETEPRSSVGLKGCSLWGWNLSLFRSKRFLSNSLWRFWGLLVQMSTWWVQHDGIISNRCKVTDDPLPSYLKQNHSIFFSFFYYSQLETLFFAAKSLSVLVWGVSSSKSSSSVRFLARLGTEACSGTLSWSLLRWFLAIYCSHPLFRFILFFSPHRC